VRQRLRQIGVCKTLGASSGRVLALMLWDFSKPVILANIVAWPLAWMAARAYLNLFCGADRPDGLAIARQPGSQPRDRLDRHGRTCLAGGSRKAGAGAEIGIILGR
jgi:hypothetical protein